MAKCIRVVGQGMPVRMSDEDAFQIVVRDKGGDYIAKCMWRGLTPAPHVPMRAKLVGRKTVEVATLARRLQHPRGGFVDA
jgi:hypothetical protein